ncbi:MAG: hypothetical protein OXI96_04365 [Acidimicrobiaceae bacterium]|nr:hypothetical protein [Acidimicrobiaceae bacterium]
MLEAGEVSALVVVGAGFFGSVRVGEGAAGRVSADSGVAAASVVDGFVVVAMTMAESVGVVNPDSLFSMLGSGYELTSLLTHAPRTKDNAANTTIPLVVRMPRIVRARGDGLSAVTPTPKRSGRGLCPW